jgi:membrane protease YdiL (CAAX protease family)
VLVALVLITLANNRWLHGWGLATACAGTALLLGIARLAGCDAADLGLGRAALPRGAAWAGALIGLVALVYLAGALLPMTRSLFDDQRNAGLGLGAVLLRALVYVPIGTVMLEEVAFRGVLYALVRRGWGGRWATAVSSLLFGLWHILPSLDLASDKPALGSVFGDSLAGRVVVDLGAVLFTALAGALFCELRRRSGSLLPPAALHWSTNALGYLAGYLLR